MAIETEYLILYIHALANKMGLQKLALSADMDLRTMKLGVMGRYADEEPVANVLQNYSFKSSDKISFYLTYKPSALELGVLWRCRRNIDKIFFMDEFSLKYYTITHEYGEQLHTVADSELDFSINKELLNIDNPSFTNKIEKIVPYLSSAKLNIQHSRLLLPEIASMFNCGLDKRKSLGSPLTNPKLDEGFMRLVYAMVYLGWNDYEPVEPGLSKRAHGNNIGGIIVDASGKIIAWGLNLRSLDRAYHAETLMIQNYLRRTGSTSLPDGATVYTSLQCCYMCAGHIASLGSNIRVIYGLVDHSFNTNTALSKQLNGCKEMPTTLPYRSLFNEAMIYLNPTSPESLLKHDVVEFLFGKHSFESGGITPAKHLLSRTLTDLKLFSELKSAVQQRTGEINEQDSYSKEFLEELDSFLSELNKEVFAKDVSDTRRPRT